jgi:hypothetical protein
MRHQARVRSVQKSENAAKVEKDMQERAKTKRNASKKANSKPNKIWIPFSKGDRVLLVGEGEWIGAISQPSNLYQVIFPSPRRFWLTTLLAILLAPL